VWKLFVEQHRFSPAMQFYETKPHANKIGALKRALAIYRNPAWGIAVLRIDGPNDEHMEAEAISAWCKRAEG